MQTSILSTHSDTGAVRKPTHDEIAATAYQLFLEQGAEHGHAVEDWLRAEQMLTERLNGPPTPRSTPGKHEEKNVKNVPKLDNREHPLARDERGTPDREDIRRKTTPFRPASRQTRSGHQDGKHRTRIEV